MGAPGRRGLLGRAAATPLSEYLDVVWVAPLVLRVRLALWTAPFQSVRERFPPLAPATAIQGEQAIVRRWATAVGRAARLVPDASCLTKALTLCTVLRRRGIGCEVKIGVRRREGADLEAHAWVEHDGRVVIGRLPDLATFSVIPRAV